MVVLLIASSFTWGQVGSNQVTKPPANEGGIKQSASPDRHPVPLGEPVHNITVLPAQPVVNNVPSTTDGLNLMVELLRVIPTFLAAFFGYLVAMRSVEKKAGIDEKAAHTKQEFDKSQQEERLQVEAIAERRRQLGLIHQDRADALSTIIGKTFTFAAAAYRTHAALTTLESYARSGASNIDEKRQDYFAERARLAEAAALLNGEAEKYGLLPPELKLKRKYLTNYVHDWSDSFNRRANDSNESRDAFTTEAYAIVNDLRKLKEHEDTQRLALVMAAELKRFEQQEFDWLID